MTDVRKRHFAGCVSGGGKTRELAAHARRAALTAIDLRGTEGHCTGERLFISGARTWCDVRAVASNNQPDFAWPMCSRAALLAVSRMVANHASVPRARAALRWL